MATGRTQKRACEIASKCSREFEAASFHNVGMDMPARAINRNCLDLMFANWRFAAAIEKLVMGCNLNMIALAIRHHPRSKYRHFKRVLSYEEGAQIPSRILKIGQYEIQKTIPLRYMGLEGRQITSFQLKIRNPWRYKVWPIDKDIDDER